MENTNKLSQINLNLFIVPNKAVEYSELHTLSQRAVDEKLAIIGIDNPKSGKYVQVWIHDVEHEIDNCTDHGYADEVIDALNITDRYQMYAPTLVPEGYFDGIVEGSTKTTTSHTNIPVTMKFEQLPYRYGDNGKIEEVLAVVTR